MTIYKSGTTPFTLVGDAGDVTSLRTLLENAYGTNIVDKLRNIQLSYTSQKPYWDASYWDPANPSFTTILQNGRVVEENETITINGQDAIDQISFRAGNMIYANVSIAFQTGPDSFQEMALKTVPTALGEAGAYDRIVTAQDIVASARQLAQTFNGVPNDNDCYYIADTIASAAGAPLPLDSYWPNPALNVPGGYWSIVHKGTQDPDPNWQSLLKAGDIVRLEWADGSSPHSFTVTSNVNGIGRMQVVDNGGDEIHEHWVEYESLANPAAVTIYRISESGLYRIAGSSVGETLYGTVRSDDLRGYSGADTLMAGLGDDRLDGGRGADRMFGGRGDDYYLVDNVGDVAIEKKGEGHDRVEASVSYDLKGQYVEDLTLTGSRNTRALGNSLDNFLVGNAGDNLIRGWGGNDTLMGGAGADTLLGGSGNDLLVGGTGADIFGFDTGSGNDFIRDFDLAAGDKIDLRGQTHAVWQLQDGNALLTLSGGGTVQLAGISASEVNANFFT